jgi:hypothetical protein
MVFEEMMRQWREEHLKKRTGERLRRLKSGFQVPEQMLLERIVYPILGSLEDLHPEFEVILDGEAPMFLDIAYTNGELKIDFELDGYGPHQRDVDRYQFARERQRDILLMSAGWRVLRFAYDDVAENAEVLRKNVLRIFRKFRINTATMAFKPLERELLRYAYSQKECIVRVIDVQVYLCVGKDLTRSMLRNLADKGMFIALGKPEIRVCRYKLNVNHPSVQRFLFGVL